LPSFDVNILKTCEDGSRPLGGAHFKLFGADYYVTDDNGSTILNENPMLVADDLVSDMSTGLIHLGKLSGGEYYLVETDPPEGYLPASEPIHIVVDGASERTKTYDDEPKIRPMYVTYTQVGNSLSTSGNGVAISATALMDDSGAPMVDENGNGVYNYSYTLTVTNNCGVELPHTGGCGTTMIYLFGIMLVMIAGAGFTGKRVLRDITI
jgi:LPXTG-motif cell wall-anchored protein